MLLQILIFTAGLVGLYFGAEALVKGAATLALRYGLRPLVVGLTVVALGTSMPEFIINFLSVLAGEDNLALGNIIGSNICNIAFILGISALVLPLAVNPAMLRKEYPLMLGAMLAFYLLALDGIITQVDGFFLILGLVGFLIFVVVNARSQKSQRKDPEDISEIEAKDLRAPLWQKALYLIGGMVGLTLGAHLMVDSAITIADLMGVERVVIGLTIVAIGTSLPELAASVICALNDNPDMSIGNAMGSNLLNVLFVVGFVSMMRPLRVSQESLNTHFPVMIAFCLLLLPLAWTGRRITRGEGTLMILGFLGYLAYLVYPYV